MYFVLRENQPLETIKLKIQQMAFSSLKAFANFN